MSSLVLERCPHSVKTVSVSTMLRLMLRTQAQVSSTLSLLLVMVTYSLTLVLRPHMYSGASRWGRNCNSRLIAVPCSVAGGVGGGVKAMGGQGFLGGLNCSFSSWPFLTYKFSPLLPCIAKLCQQAIVPCASGSSCST